MKGGKWESGATCVIRLLLTSPPPDLTPGSAVLWLTYRYFCFFHVFESDREGEQSWQARSWAESQLITSGVCAWALQLGCLEVDKQISLVVEGTWFVLESSGVRVDSPGERRKHHCLPHSSTTCSTVNSLSALYLPTCLCYSVLDKQKKANFSSIPPCTIDNRLLWLNCTFT